MPDVLDIESQLGSEFDRQESQPRRSLESALPASDLSREFDRQEQAQFHVEPPRPISTTAGGPRLSLPGRFSSPLDELDQGEGPSIGKMARTVGLLGRGLRAGVADAASKVIGLPAENLPSFARDISQQGGDILQGRSKPAPSPIDTQIQEAAVEERARGEVPWRSTMAGAATKLTGDIPKFAALTLAGPSVLAQSIAAGGIFGMDDEGNFHPKEAVIMALLPGVGRLARLGTASLVGKAAASGIKGLENPAVQKVLEEVGHQAALDGYMALTSAPELIQQYQQDPTKAALSLGEIMVQNLGFAVLGAGRFRSGVASDTESWIRDKAKQMADDAVKARVSQDYTGAQLKDIFNRVTSDDPSATEQEKNLVTFINSQTEAKGGKGKGILSKGARVTTSERDISKIPDFWKKYLPKEQAFESVEPLTKGATGAVNPEQQPSSVQGQPAGTEQERQAPAQGESGNRVPDPAGQPSPVVVPPETPGAATGPVAAVAPDWALDELKRRGWNTGWPFVPADLANPTFVAGIQSDPMISDADKKKILSFAPGGENEIRLGGQTPVQQIVHPASVTETTPPGRRHSSDLPERKQDEIEAEFEKQEKGSKKPLAPERLSDLTDRLLVEWSNGRIPVGSGINVLQRKHGLSYAQAESVIAEATKRLNQPAPRPRVQIDLPVKDAKRAQNLADGLNRQNPDLEAKVEMKGKKPLITVNSDAKPTPVQPARPTVRPPSIPAQRPVVPTAAPAPAPLTPEEQAEAQKQLAAETQGAEQTKPETLEYVGKEQQPTATKSAGKAVVPQDERLSKINSELKTIRNHFQDWAKSKKEDGPQYTGPPIEELSRRENELKAEHELLLGQRKAEIQSAKSSEDVSALKQAKPVKSEDALMSESQIKITAPEGATQIRVTDKQGSKSIQPISDLKKGNSFQGVDVARIEAGTIDRAGKFKPIDGEVKVEAKNQAQASLATASTEATPPQALPDYKARSVEELKALLPHVGLPAQSEAMIREFLNLPLIDKLPKFRTLITDALDGGWQGSKLQDLVSITRGADPITGAHEILHVAYDILPDDIKAELERMRVASLDSMIKEAQEAGKPETEKALTDLRDNPTTGGEDFLARGYPVALQSQLYPFSSGEEFFTHSASERFKQRVGSTVEGFWARVKEIISNLISAIKRALKLRPNQKEFLDSILEGRFESADLIAVAELERTNAKYSLDEGKGETVPGSEGVEGAGKDVEPVLDERRESLLRADAVRRLSGLLFGENDPRPNARVLRLVPPESLLSGGGNSPKMGDAAREGIERAFDVRVVFIDVQGPPGSRLEFNGLKQPEIPGFVFVNARTPMPHLAVIGHELVHDLSQRDPETFRELVEKIEPLMRDFGSYHRELIGTYMGRGKLPLMEDAAKENLVGDLLGNSFIDPQFWNRLAEKEPGLFQRLARAVLDFLRDTWQKLKQFGAEQYFSDIPRARDILADAVIKFAKRQRDGTPVPGETKYSLSPDDQKEELDRMLDEAAELHRIPTLVLGEPYYVTGRETLDPATGHQLAKQMLDSAGISSTEQIVRRNGQDFPVWVMTPQGRDMTPEGELLLKAYKDSLAASVPGKASQDLGAIINTIRLNFEWPATKSAMAEMAPRIRVELWEAVQSNASARGIALRALMGVRDDIITVGRNIDAELGKIWSDAMGGDAIRRILDDLNAAKAEIERLKSLGGLGQGKGPGTGIPDQQAEIDRLKKALEDALKKHAPTMRKRWGSGTTMGKKILELIQGGKGNPWDVLRAMAPGEGFKVPTDEQLTNAKRWADKLDEMTNLTPEEAAGKNADQQAEMMRLKSAGLADETMRLRKNIETLWTRLAKPYSIRTRAGRENITSAIGDYISANFLAKIGFATRQAIDVTTQMATYIPTSAVSHVLMLHEQEVAAGKRNRSDVGAIWKDLSTSLGAAYRVRVQALRGAFDAAGAVVTGANQGRNVAQLMQRVSIYDKAMQRAEELDAKGEHGKAWLLKFFTLHKVGYVISQALDQFQGVPLVHQEMHQQVVRAMRDNGLNPAEAEAKADYVLGDPRRDTELAKAEAILFLEGAGIEATKAAVQHAAWRIAQAKAYERIRALGLNADDFQNRNLFMLEANAWNIREEGGVGGTAGNIMREGAKLGRSIAGAGKLGLPVGVAITSMTRFGNAIAIMLNRKLTWAGLGFFPGWFGVDEREIGEDGIAKGGSSFFKYPEQRRQRKVEAAVGMLGQIAMYLLVASGAIIVRLAWPKDKEERQVWDRMGWKPGQVDIPTGSDTHIRFSLNVGPMAMFAPGLSAGAAIHDLGDREKKAQDKLNSEAEKLGLEPGKIRARNAGDYLAAATDAAWRSLTSGRTISGLLSSFSEQGSFHVAKSVSSLASAVSPYQPGLQEILRMASGTVPDTRTASVWDFFMPLASSKSAQVNFMGDPVGSGNAVQRMVETLTGGNNLLPINDKQREGLAAYQAVFANGWRPPSIDPNRGYAINGQFRPMTDSELRDYTVARGQYLRQELSDLGPDATAKQAAGAFQRANRQALEDTGVEVPSRAARGTAQATGGAGRAAAPSGAAGGASRATGAGRGVSVRGPSIRRTAGPRTARAAGLRRGPTLGRVGRGLSIGPRKTGIRAGRSLLSFGRQRRQR